MLICRNRHFGSKRLRRKHRLFQYAEYVIKIVVSYNNSIDIDVVCDDFIDYIERNGLYMFGIWGNGSIDLYISRRKESCDVKDVEYVRSFFVLGFDVKDIRLIDANYDPI